MADQLIRVLIVDDHQVVRRSLQAMLGGESDIEVVSTAVNGEEAIQLAQQLTPDVIVMDVSMPELDGIRAAGKIRDLGIATKVIILSMHYDSALLHQARKNGVSGYLVKQQANIDLVPAIRAAYVGELSL